MKKTVFILILLFFVSGCNQQINGCKIDSDCFQEQCCHPTSCVLKENSPSCKGVICTMECKPGTLDCGQGSCKCVNNKCEAVYEQS